MWASVPVYQMALTLTKLSILVQYWRVFVSKNIRRMIVALFAITLVYGTSFPHALNHSTSNNKEIRYMVNSRHILHVHTHLLLLEHHHANWPLPR